MGSKLPENADRKRHFAVACRTHVFTGVANRPCSDRALGNLVNSPSLGLLRPDVIDVDGRNVWELKPITHKSNATMAADDQVQLTGYLSALGGTDGPFSRGDPNTIVDTVKGGEYAGSFWDNGKEFDVRLYPGEKGSGMFYYTLKETGRTLLKELGKSATEIGKEMARHPPIPPVLPPRGPREDPRD